MKLRGVRWSKFVTQMGKMIFKYESFIRISDEKSHSEDLDVDGGIILHYMLKEWNVKTKFI
jgi:hypothetical protein